MVEGFGRRNSLALWKLRLLAYPAWNQNVEKPPKISEWMPIPDLDKTDKGKFSKRELKELQKIVEEYK